MTIRPWKRGTDRKRQFSLPDTTSLNVFVDMLPAVLGEGATDVTISRGAYLEWYSPATPEELAWEAEQEAAIKVRQEAWERETYERLRAKFTRPLPLDVPVQIERGERDE